MAHEAPPVLEEAQALSIFTPVNLILLSLTVYIIYTRLFSRASTLVAAPAPAPLVFQTFTPKTLAPYNGVQEQRVLMAVQGDVFDVTAGKSFYGPGGPYSNFAGRDASRGLALNSFDEEVLTELDKPIDRLEGLSADEMASLCDWKKMFEGKYLLVGKLVDEGSEEAKAAGL